VRWASEDFRMKDMEGVRVCMQVECVGMWCRWEGVVCGRMWCMCVKGCMGGGYVGGWEVHNTQGISPLCICQY